MKRIFIRLIRAYQAVSWSLSPGPLFLGSYSGCRSWPTCSEYALDVIERDGAIRGIAKSIARVARCNPLWPTQRHG
ncbi:MAG: membrane protein insertion efficiency factor YidD [Patescibacteria group bacterium]